MKTTKETEHDMLISAKTKEVVLELLEENETIYRELSIISNKYYDIYKKLGYPLSDFDQCDIVIKRGLLFDAISKLKAQLWDLMEDS